MSLWFESIFSDTDSGIVGSSYTATIKTRKWLIVLLIFVYLVKTETFAVKGISIPYVELVLPTKNDIIFYGHLLSYYLFAMFILTLSSLILYEYNFLIRQKKFDLLAPRIKDAIQGLSNEIEKSIRESSRSVDFEKGFGDSIQYFSRQLSDQMLPKSDFAARVSISLVPQVIADFIRFGSVILLFVYVMYFI
jgi:hypothetical protein